MLVYPYSHYRTGNGTENDYWCHLLTIISIQNMALILFATKLPLWKSHRFQHLHVCVCTFSVGKVYICTLMKIMIIMDGRKCLQCLTGSELDHRSLPPEFESRGGHIWRLFHLWLHLITFGGRSAHLPYHVHKSDHTTSIIIIICRYLNLLGRDIS